MATVIRLAINKGIMVRHLQSEHRARLHFQTIISILVIVLLFLTSLAGIVSVVYARLTGRGLAGSDFLLALTGGVIIATFCSFALTRYVSRMLPIKKVLLFEDDRVEIVTRRNKTFVAKLPDSIKHMQVIGTDITVTLQIGGRHFVVDSERFSDKQVVNQFWRRFLERYK